MDQSKEPDAGPQVRFCERREGAILRAYSTPPRAGAFLLSGVVFLRLFHQSAATSVFACGLVAWIG